MHEKGKLKKRLHRFFLPVYMILLAAAVCFVMLDTFVLPDAGTAAATTSSDAAQAVDTSKASITDSSYSDDNIQISLTTKRVDNTTVYIADVQVSDASYLKTAFAQAAYGRNIKETTSDMASDNNAILAVNGDYYGFRDDGYVVRNGTVYRSEGNGSDDLVIYKDGTFKIVNESDATAEELVSDGAEQVLSFGPALVNNSEITVSENEEVSQAMTSNPRTAIGMISPLHYVFVVSDGRTSESEGLTLYELAQVMQDQGCTVAYNLDGGGSTTMVFNGTVVNNPTGGRGGNGNEEREVSDIVYIG